MAGNKTSVLKTIIEFETRGDKKVVKSMKTLEKQAGVAGVTIEKTTKKTKKGWKEAEKVITDYNAAQKEAEARAKKIQAKFGAMRNMMMGIGFSFLFTGMAIKNFFQGILRSLINTFQIAQADTSAFNQSVSELQGAWEFLKYSIMDALEQTGVLDWVIGSILSLINWLNRLSPYAKATFGVMALVITITAGVMMVLGQATLALLGPLAMLEAAGYSVGAAWGITLGILVIIAATMIALIMIWTSDMPTMAKLALTAAVAVAAISGSLLLLGTIAGTTFAGLLAIAAFIALLGVARMYTDNWADAFTLAGLAIIKVINQTIAFLIGRMTPVIAMIDALIWASNTLAGTDFEYIGPKAQDAVAGMLGVEATQTIIENIMLENMARQQEAGFATTQQGVLDNAGVEDNVFDPLTLPSDLDSLKSDINTQQNNIVDNKTININISQQPGESSQEFMERLMEEYEEKSTISNGSTQSS